MASLLDRVYAHSPVFVQNVMATGYGVQQRVRRYRGEFARFCTELERQQWLPAAALQELQDAAVRRTVAFAAACVPYYRELFAREGIRPEHIRTAADLPILPLLDKATVQEQGARLRPDRRRVPGIVHTTGGTTGRPVPYWVSPQAIQFNYAAYEVRFRNWAGVGLGDSMVSINGKPIVPMTQDGPPYWRHNLAFRQLYVSAYHLSDRNLPAIADRIEAFAPAVIVAYVSAVHRIARFVLETGRTGQIRPRAVLVSSETLFDGQRAEIEAAFGCKVYNGYSLGEPVCLATECPAGSMHTSPEYGAIELVPSEGDNDGGLEIVATGLINDAMPLLRYRTGDRATAGDGAPCRCGRTLPTIGAITGRIDEVVVTPEGTSVGPAALSLAFQGVPHLRESQIVQDRPEAITLRLATAPGYGPADEQFLLGELRKRLGLGLEIDVERVDAVPRTVSGKQRLIVSSLRSNLRSNPRSNLPPNPPPTPPPNPGSGLPSGPTGPGVRR
jgi:phenylacetate-CoA ligase